MPLSESAIAKIVSLDKQVDYYYPSKGYTLQPGRPSYVIKASNSPYPINCPVCKSARLVNEANYINGWLMNTYREETDKGATSFYQVIPFNRLITKIVKCYYQGDAHGKRMYWMNRKDFNNFLNEEYSNLLTQIFSRTNPTDEPPINFPLGFKELPDQEYTPTTSEANIKELVEQVSLFGSGTKEVIEIPQIQDFMITLIDSNDRTTLKLDPVDFFPTGGAKRVSYWVTYRKQRSALRVGFRDRRTHSLPQLEEELRTTFDSDYPNLELNLQEDSLVANDKESKDESDPPVLRFRERQEDRSYIATLWRNGQEDYISLLTRLIFSAVHQRVGGEELRKTPTPSQASHR